LDTAKLGVVFYGGALVDPRGYSPVAKMVSERYGMAVVIQIFEDDIPLKFGSCNTGRLDLASKEFPYIEKWVLVGHSLGGTAAMTDVWTLMNDTNRIAGLVLLASYIRDDIGCGEIDFSSTSMPMASVNASLDGVINATNFLAGQPLLPINDTFHMEILGGNHGHFGSYNDSERTTLLGQMDGNATIPEKVQQDLAVGAIANVAARSGIPLAMWDGTVNDNTSGGSRGRLGCSVVASAIIAYFVVL
jgi:pimeloyl-ACP methyl ester carboxylesterase